MSKKSKCKKPANMRYAQESRWRSNKIKQLEKHLKGQPNEKQAQKKLDKIKRGEWRGTRK